MDFHDPDALFCSHSSVSLFITSKEESMNWHLLFVTPFYVPLVFSLFIGFDSIGSTIVSAETSNSTQSPFFSDLEAFKEKNLTLQSKKNSLSASSEGLLSKKLFWTPTISSHLQKSKEFSRGSIGSSSSLTSNSESETLLGVEMNWNLFQGGKSCPRL